MWCRLCFCLWQFGPPTCISGYLRNGPSSPKHFYDSELVFIFIINININIMFSVIIQQLPHVLSIVVPNLTEFSARTHVLLSRLPQQLLSLLSWTIPVCLHFYTPSLSLSHFTIVIQGYQILCLDFLVYLSKIVMVLFQLRDSFRPNEIRNMEYLAFNFNSIFGVFVQRKSRFLSEK